MPMDWDRYKELERQERAICGAVKVTVEFSYEDYRAAKWGMMLMRRLFDRIPSGELQSVDERVAPLIGKVGQAFRELPEVRALIDERKRMLEEAETERKQKGEEP